MALANLQASLELDDVPSITDETKAMVLAYNNDDWCLRQRAAGLVGNIARPIGSGVARTCPARSQAMVRRQVEGISDWLIKINALIERLTADLPVDPEARNEEEQARWILANIIDWHRREDKAGVVGVFPAVRSFG